MSSIVAFLVAPQLQADVCSGRITGYTEHSWNRVETSVMPTIRIFKWLGGICDFETCPLLNLWSQFVIQRWIGFAPDSGQVAQFVIGLRINAELLIALGYFFGLYVPYFGFFLGVTVVRH